MLVVRMSVDGLVTWDWNFFSKHTGRTLYKYNYTSLAALSQVAANFLGPFFTSYETQTGLHNDEYRSEKEQVDFHGPRVESFVMK